QRAFTIRADRSYKSVFASAALFHADHLRAKFGKQCRAIGTCDIPPEIEHPHPLQNSTHRPILFLHQAPYSSIASLNRRLRTKIVRTQVESHALVFPARGTKPWLQRHPRKKIDIRAFEDADAELAAIAYEGGFASHSHFSTHFRDFCGLTPLELRRKNEP